MSGRKWGTAIVLRVKPSETSRTSSGHAYRFQRGLEIYVWTENAMNNGAQVGVVTLSRKQIEEYLREARRRERLAKARRKRT